MRRMSRRAIRPGFDDLKGRELLSMMSPSGTSLSARWVGPDGMPPSTLKDKQRGFRVDGVSEELVGIRATRDGPTLGRPFDEAKEQNQ